jgi:hypothetical protein
MKATPNVQNLLTAAGGDSSHAGKPSADLPENQKATDGKHQTHPHANFEPL